MYDKGGGVWRQLLNDVKAAIKEKNGPCMRGATAPENRQGAIDPSYMTRVSVDKADTIFYERDKKTGKLLAFLLAKWHDPQPGAENRCGADDKPKRYDVPALETMIVCSRETTSAKPLVLESLREARRRGKDIAELCALKHVVGYYPRYGYKTAGHGDDAHGYPFVKNLRNTKNWYAESEGGGKKKISANDINMVTTRRTARTSPTAHQIIAAANIVANAIPKKTTPMSVIRASPSSSSNSAAAQLIAHGLAQEAVHAAIDKQKKKKTSSSKKKTKEPKARTVRKLPELKTPSTPGLVIHTKKQAPGTKSAYITKAGLHRLAKSQGIQRVQKKSLEETIGALQPWIQELVSSTLKAANAAGRKTVKLEDVKVGFMDITKENQTKTSHSVYLTGTEDAYKHLRKCYLAPHTSQDARAVYKWEHGVNKRGVKTRGVKTTEIRHYTRPGTSGEWTGMHECLSFPQKPFDRIVKGIAAKYVTAPKFTRTALNAIQYLVEKHVSTLFSDSRLAIKHAKRVTLMPKNVRVVRNLRTHPHMDEDLPAGVDYKRRTKKEIGEIAKARRDLKLAKQKTKAAHKNAEKAHEAVKKTPVAPGAQAAHKKAVKATGEAKKTAQQAAQAATKIKLNPNLVRRGSRTRTATTRR